MKKVVYLGYVVSPDEANQDSGASVAGNKMQWNVIKNLVSWEDVDITCVTVTPLAAFPHDKKMFQGYEVRELIPGVASHQVAYLNFPVIKQFFQIINVYKTAKKVIKEKQADVLFCFNMFPQVGIPMRWLKKRFPELDTICLLADLPIDDNTNRKGLSLFLRRKMEKSTWKSMRACEQYIVLNKQVIEKYLPDKPYIVVDGGIDEGDIERYDVPGEKNGEHNIVYCGALTKYNGIINLISAMKYVNAHNVVLDIYGDGYLRDYVEKSAKINPRIRYHGRISNQLVMQKQREAWGLINPRIIDDPIAKVTFPSKTFEYLLSGTPVISTRLNGYGEEYKGCMIFAEQDSPEGIAEAINYMAEMSSDKLKEMTKRARNMVCLQKSWKAQSKRIKKFICSDGDKL